VVAQDRYAFVKILAAFADAAALEGTGAFAGIDAPVAGDAGGVNVRVFVAGIVEGVVDAEGRVRIGEAGALTVVMRDWMVEEIEQAAVVSSLINLVSLRSRNMPYSTSAAVPSILHVKTSHTIGRTRTQRTNCRRSASERRSGVDF